MYENPELTAVKLSIEISQQKILQCFHLHTENISESVKKGVENAVKNFDFEKEIEQQAAGIIKNIISEYMWKGELKWLIEKKVSSIVTELINRETAAYEEKHKTE